MAEGVLREIADRKRRDVAERFDGTSVDPEPTRRSLRSALARPGARFVMEVKKASPSGHRSAIGIIEATEAYAPFADAISVLTDTPYFGGSLDDLRTVRSRFDGPILAKDFIVDPRQVAEARMHGADAVLAILALLSDDEAAVVMAEASRLQMDVVIEVHDELELDRAIALQGAVIGINNRDLRTLETDLGVTERLAGRVPRDRIMISESGIRGRVDVERLCRQVDAFLVGSSLMASDDIGQAARTLVHGRVKICGLTRADDAALIADAGASHAGIILADSSPRRVADPYPVATAARRHGAKTVGVFQDQEASFVARQAHELNLDAVQLHGQESGLERLRRQLPPRCEIWAACGVAGKAEPERAGADRIVYDTRAGASTGGTGRPFEWSLVAGRPSLDRALLAGGIGPGNARAAQRVGSYGIDVGSGVEEAAGIKDGVKVRALFDSLRPPCRRSASCS